MVSEMKRAWVLSHVRFVHPLDGQRVLHTIQTRLSFPQQLFPHNIKAVVRPGSNSRLRTSFRSARVSDDAHNAHSLVPSSVLFLLLHTVQPKHQDGWDKWYRVVPLKTRLGGGKQQQKDNKQISVGHENIQMKIHVVESVSILETKRSLRNRVLGDLWLDKGTFQNPWGNASASERLWNIWGGNCCQTSTCDVCIYLKGKEASSSYKHCGEHGLASEAS